MAEIKPFQAIRPADTSLAGRIAALPYDVYNRAEAKAEVLREPMSFLGIDSAEVHFQEEVSAYDDCVYAKAGELLNKRIADGSFLTEEKACYYIYELTMQGRTQTGIVACAGVDDYLNNTIKKHENTRAEKEVDRIRHVTACEAQTGPIFLAYRSIEVINLIIEETKKSEPLYDFTAMDGISHRVWMIAEETDVRTIKEAFSKTGQIYIADGHHRCASAVKVALKKREECPAYMGTEEFNYFLSVLFPDDQLMIMDYNRVVKDINGLSADAFLLKLQDIFAIENRGKTPYKPEKKGEIAMFLENTWYRLTFKRAEIPENPVEGLDVSRLQNEVLAPILAIQDPKTDRRIDFVGGIRGLAELEKRVREDCKIAFALYPTSILELFAVSDADLLMPPKSTWFEPKLRSGLFLHRI